MSATSSFDMAGRLCRSSQLDLQGIKRALDLPDCVESHARVARGGIYMPVPEQVLDNADIDALLQKMGGETVPQCMHGDGLIKASNVSRLAASALNRPCRDRP